MAASASMEHNGVPIDVPTLTRLQRHWNNIQDRLISTVDAHYGVFEGRTFKRDRFAAWLARNNIPWARLADGELDLSDNAFREAARAYPVVAPLGDAANIEGIGIAWLKLDRLV